MNLKLRAKRVEKGFTQKELANALGVATATYNRWEIGKTDITNKDIMKLLQVLECKYEDIFLY